jgi:hypothetical protein
MVSRLHFLALTQKKQLGQLQSLLLRRVFFIIADSKKTGTDFDEFMLPWVKGM